MRVKGIGHVGSMGWIRKAYSILVRNLEGKRPLVMPRCRWEYNNKENLK
jgi:hypothetical protein